MRLTIVTPAAVVVDATGVAAVRAADETGWFGVLRGHAEFLTALRSTVVSWRTEAGAERHCAVRGGVLRVSGGDVSIATREAIAGEDLEHLEDQVLAAFARASAEEAQARVAEERLHLAAIRRIVGGLQRDRAAGTPPAARPAPE